MDMNQAFPSDFLKASDLKGSEVTVTMDYVAMKELGDDEKPVLYFQGTEKGMVLNKTNCNTIIEMFGPSSDAWKGNRIILFPTQTDFQGRQVACIRVKIFTSNKEANAALDQASQADQGVGDEVPF